MDVAAYLKELLSQERVVYVPGLGTFLTRKSAGVYNQEKQQFYPPKNSIDFVEEEKQDEALATYISIHKNISTAAARYFIEKFVEQLETEAATKNIPVKEALFPAEEEAELGFAVAVSAYNMENFGLPLINLPNLKKTIQPEEKPVEVIYQEFSDPSETETQPKRYTGFWASVILLLTVGLLGCYALYLYHPELFSRFSGKKLAVESVKHLPVTDTLGKNAAVLPRTKPDTLAAKAAVDTPETIVSKPATAALSKTETAPKPVTKDTSIVATAADPDLIAKSPYEIIGASFKTINGAKAFLNQLKAKGMHRAKILNNTAGKQKLVTFGSFTDKEPAQAALEKLRAKDPQSEAYIQHYIIK